MYMNIYLSLKVSLYVVGYRCTCTLCRFAFHQTLFELFKTLTCPKTTKKTIYKNATDKQATINAQRRRRGEEELVEGADGGVCRAIGGRHKDWLKPGRRGS